MSETEEIRRRMDALEAEMDALREQITTTRAVVAINDRDVAEFKTELRAHKQVLQALRETQIEQGREIAELRTEMRNGFATVLTAVQAIADRLPDGPPGEARP
ncbi:hypothetical protein K4749_23325 [Streptomyces sp. TRM72054]|uniref:hypothetical protein n=1 Tax=Streptomyces sp. TRM72054 TaxID=2870562 RepID=UPI001C8B1968|nr:hypothetical protein [Streptomyces sp. TRM72054]MBX9396442.1 hypothetical protein [Streptomyces sp. TRM72054]